MSQNPFIEGLRRFQWAETMDSGLVNPSGSTRCPHKESMHKESFPRLDFQEPVKFLITHRFQAAVFIRGLWEMRRKVKATDTKQGH